MKYHWKLTEICNIGSYFSSVSSSFHAGPIVKRCGTEEKSNPFSLALERDLSEMKSQNFVLSFYPSHLLGYRKIEIPYHNNIKPIWLNIENSTFKTNAFSYLFYKLQ